MLFCESFEGYLKLLVLVHAAPAELGLAAAAEETAAKSAQSVIDQVREVIRGKRLVALKFVIILLLCKCCEQGVFCRVNMFSANA